MYLPFVAQSGYGSDMEHAVSGRLSLFVSVIPLSKL